MDRETFQSGLLQIKPREIWCSFQPNGSGSPTLYAAGSRGVASVARSSAGKFLITLRDAFSKRGPVSVAIEHASDATDLTTQFAGFGNLGTSSAATITVRVKQGSTSKDLTLASTTWVHVCAHFEDSSEA